MVLLLAAPGAALAPSAPQVIPDTAFQPVVVGDIIIDDFPSPTLPPRPVVEAPAAPTLIEKIPRPTVSSTPAREGSLTGRASWYCRAGVSVCHYQYPDGPGFDAYAAAGPRLRQAIGDWRGRVVSVNGIRVKLIDWCQCSKGRAGEKVIDLYWDVAHALDITGVGQVVVRW